MGQFIYGRTPTSVEVDDRTLAHLKVVVATKLRRGEPFFLELDAGSGSGRRSFWLHPAVAVQFHFYGSRQPRLNRAWIDDLMASAHSATGLQIVPEPGERDVPAEL